MNTDIKLVSNTLVKNGMPFIGLVLDQVLPLVDRAVITLSEKSDSKTVSEVMRIKNFWEDKVELLIENVKEPGELTQERQRQLGFVPNGSWVLFLDDDDYWPTESLRQAIMFLGSDCDALSVNPYQVIDDKLYDNSWKNKWFTKLFKKNATTNYKHPWPRDMIYNGDTPLYWKRNPRNIRIAPRFFHLSNIKDGSFRRESWARDFKSNIGAPTSYPEVELQNVKKIFDYARRNK